MTLLSRSWRPGLRLSLALLVAGCAGGAPAEPVPSSTRWGPELSLEEALARIPLAGDENSPLYWELPAVEHPDLAAAMLAARRFRALDYYTASAPTDAGGHLYQWVATERMIEIQYPDGPPEPEGDGFPPSHGPVWLRVVDVERVSASTTMVSTCEDRGWLGTVGRPEELPSVNRAFIWHFLVVKRIEDGQPRWLVDEVWADRDQLGPDVWRECQQWATHEPEEDR